MSLNYLEKIKKVRENLQEWQKEHGKQFSYQLMGIGVGEDPIDDWTYLVSPEEETDIIKYLKRRGFIEIIEEKPTSIKLKILPRKEPVIKLKTLELIARELKDYFTGTEIIDFLKNCGVEQKFIVYPNSKWAIFYGVFEELAISQDKRAHDLLFKLIAESVHPLNLNGSEEASEMLVGKLNQLLKYNNLEIQYTDALMNFVLVDKLNKSSSPDMSEVEEMEKENMQNEFEEMEKEELAFFQKPEKIEKISILRKNYQTLMNLVEVFCENPSRPTTELNNAFVKLRGNVFQIIASLGLLDKNLFVYSFSEDNHRSYDIPFLSLFSAEKEFKEKRKRLSWDTIRPEMNAMFGEIDRLYQDVNASDVLSEPNTQTQINDIMLLLTETKKQNEKANTAKTKVSPHPIPIQKIEITAMPELQIKNVEENTLQKGKKRIRLPKFKPTDWSKISIRFIDERNVLITADKRDVVQSDYEALGFADDKKGKPNMAWAFFYGLAINNGETKELPNPIPDRIKQQKKQLSDRLKTIFKNDTDPFYEPTETRTYKIKMGLIPPTPEERPDKYGTKEYLDETMTEEYEDV